MLSLFNILTKSITDKIPQIIGNRTKAMSLNLLNKENNKMVPNGRVIGIPPKLKSSYRFLFSEIVWDNLSIR